MPGGGDMIPGQFRCYTVNLVPRVVSEPLFQYSSQKTTLARGEGESFLWEYLKLPILGFECRTLCCSLLFRHFIFSMDGKTFCPMYLNMHQMNSRDKKSVKSNLKQSYFRIGAGEFLSFTGLRQLLSGKGLDLLSGYRIRGVFASIFSFRLNSFHLAQLTRLGKTSMSASFGRN